MSEKQVIFDVGELKLISFLCGKCGAEVIIDISKTLHNRFPRNCVCGEEYPKCALPYKEFYDLAIENKVRIRASWPEPAQGEK
jgi:hypothetical protein